MRTLLLLSLVLPACQGPETGLDESVLTGTVTIPPASLAEVDTDKVTNDAVDAAQGVGVDGATALTYRSVLVSGTMDQFGFNIGGGPPYDPDCYGFAPLTEGTFTLGFTYDVGGDGTRGMIEGNVYEIVVYDLAAYDGAGGGVVWDELTDGWGGAYVGELELSAGAEYVVEVIGYQSAEGGSSDYTLRFSGATPGEETILVGAYLEGDPAVASAPVGGTTATDWTYDDATSTWNGAYTAKFLRSVTTEASGDTATPPTVTVNEDVGAVYLMAGTLQTLNKAPSAGALYSTTSVQVDPTGADVAVSTPIVLDGVFPKVIGTTVTEPDPDTSNAVILFNDDVGVYQIDMKTLSAVDVGMLSGLGYVDVVDGSITFGGTTGWNGDNDSDAYMFTVPQEAYVSMVASWPGDAGAYDIDFGIWGDYDPYGQLEYFSSFSDSYCLTGSNPEVCETVVPLEPDITYYLVALGYAGSDAQPYHIELEWIAP